jgi:AcrR family transcriptional regulator
MMGRPAASRADRRPSEARQRILDTAYALFTRDGVRAVGVDRIIAESGVAKMTLYRHFPSKEELVLAYLDLRTQRWTRGWLEREIERRAATPRGRMLALFDAYDEWFRRRDFEGCGFVRTMFETYNSGRPAHAAAVRHLGAVADLLERLATEAGIKDPRRLAQDLHLLALGAVVAATSGASDAALRARQLAQTLIDRS